MVGVMDTTNLSCDLCGDPALFEYEDRPPLCESCHDYQLAELAAEADYERYSDSTYLDSL